MSDPLAVGGWDAAAYDRVSDPQVAWARGVLDRLPLRGDETVLDAGCGTGRATELLLDRLPRGRVVALDRSPAMLGEARARLDARAPGRVRYVCADLGRLDGLEPVDAVFSTATFHWVPDHDALFRGLLAALRPGGRLVAQCGGAGNLARVLGRADALAAAEPFAPHFEGWTRPSRFETAAATAGRLAAAGFVDVETTLTDTPTTFADADAFRAFLRTVVLRPHLGRLPGGDLRERLLDAVVDAAAADRPPFTLDYRRLDLSGRRPEA